MAINGASDPVVRLAIFHRQEPHDHVRPQRNAHLWPTPRHHDRLTNSEPMSGHGGAAASNAISVAGCVTS